jgi:hypothetical protein
LNRRSGADKKAEAATTATRFRNRAQGCRRGYAGHAISNRAQPRRGCELFNGTSTRQIDCAAAIVARTFAGIGHKYFLVLRRGIPENLRHRPGTIPVENNQTVSFLTFNFSFLRRLQNQTAKGAKDSQRNAKKNAFAALCGFLTLRPLRFAFHCLRNQLAFAWSVSADSRCATSRSIVVACR